MQRLVSISPVHQMGKNLSPVLRRELENLDKDSDSRKSAMKALKSYVKDLDIKAIPIFLEQVSETKETGLTSGEYTISLYEVLARVHGTKIVPQIDNIMSTIIKTLSTSVISFALHQACSKVVPAIARYGMDPTTPENKKRRIIHSLCKPLSDSLLSSQENLSSGAALCLKALVDSDNWRFASSELVNEVCQRVTVALEKPMQTNSHMGLVMSLAEHNASVVEAYARLLIWSGIKILNIGASEGNSQKRLVAIQMVNFLMKCLDYKCILSELDSLLSSQENLSSGAALCLKALVDSDNWRFASSELVNEVCQRVTVALEKPMQTNSHMGLVMSLAEHNASVVEAYARLLIWSGIKILNIGASEGNSQKRLVAIQMVNFLMKCLDYKCILSELDFVIEEMKKCEDDQMAFVKGAAFEATQTAKRILMEKGSKVEKRSGQRSDSPVSQTMGSFSGYSTVINSPFSDSMLSEVNSNRSVSRKQWRRENGLDISLKDGIFSSGMCTPKSVIENCEHNGFSEDQGDYADEFSGFVQESQTNGGSRSATPSPQKSRSYINLDNVKIFTTPSKLVKSLQAPNELYSDSDKQSQRFRSPVSSKYENGVSGDLSDRFAYEDEQYHQTTESVCSTEDIFEECIPETKATHWFFALRILSGLAVLFAIIVCFLLVGGTDEDCNLVPT